MNHFIRINAQCIGGYNLLQFQDTGHYISLPLDLITEKTSRYISSQKRIDTLFREGIRWTYHIECSSGILSVCYGIFLQEAKDAYGREGISFVHCLEFSKNDWLYITVKNSIKTLTDDNSLLNIIEKIAISPSVSDLEHLINILQNVFLLNLDRIPFKSANVIPKIKSIIHDYDNARIQAWLYFAYIKTITHDTEWLIQDEVKNSSITTTIHPFEGEAIFCSDLYAKVLQNYYEANKSSTNTIFLNDKIRELRLDFEKVMSEKRLLKWKLTLVIFFLFILLSHFVMKCYDLTKQIKTINKETTTNSQRR